MNSYCIPLLDASICSKELFLAYATSDCILSFTKKGQRCSIDLPVNNGEIFLTDTEILETFDTANYFTLSLKDSTGTQIGIEYIDCLGNSVNANEVRIKFNECLTETDYLEEICD